MTEQLTATKSAEPRTPISGKGRRLPRALTPFQHAAYRRLALALILSTFASGVWVVAQVWEVIRIGGGPGQLSVVSTAGAIGVLLPALLGGVVADRVPQKLILQCVASVELTAMGLVAVLSITDTTRLWHLAAVAFVTGMGMAFYYPAYSAWLPSLVPESRGVIHILNASRTLLEVATHFGLTCGTEERNRTEPSAPNDCWAFRRGVVHRVERGDSKRSAVDLRARFDNPIDA